MSNADINYWPNNPKTKKTKLRNLASVVSGEVQRVDFETSTDYAPIGQIMIGGRNDSVKVVRQTATIHLRSDAHHPVRRVVFQGGWPNIREGENIEATIIKADCDYGGDYPDESPTTIYSRREFREEEEAIRIERGKTSYAPANFEEMMDREVAVLSSS